MLLAPSLSAGAERLSVKAYTTADGLAQNTVLRIVRDSRGFLWFCTRDGLSRFDGQAFASYGMAQGLPHPNVNHLLEARDGSYWIATNGGGVARLEPGSGSAGGIEHDPPRSRDAPASLFKRYPVGDDPITNRVNILYQDRSGVLWAGTDGELFRLDSSGGAEAFRKVDLGLPPGHRWVVVLALAEDRQGRLWIGTSEGVFVRGADGRVRQYGIRPAAEGYDWVRALLLDAEGRIWIGHLGAGVVVIDPGRWPGLDSTPSTTDRRPIQELGPALRHWFTQARGLAGDDVHAVCQSSDGVVWIATQKGLSAFDGRRFQTYGKAEGLTPTVLAWLTEDAGGNLWAATAEGALRIDRGGFVTFTHADGLGDAGVRSIFEDGAGELYVLTDDASVHVFDGRRFRGLRLLLPPKLTLEPPQTAWRDRAGEWWFTTQQGLFRFPRVGRLEDLRHVRPRAVYGKRTGLSGTNICSLYESAQGDIWISIAARHPLARWRRTSRAFQTYTAADGVPDFLPVSCFAEDRSGTLWMGMFDSGVLRYRDGRFRRFTGADGVPPGRVHQLHVDAAGRLWIATNAGGVGRMEDTAAEQPRIVTLTMKDGLRSNNVACLTEDAWGRIYLGTGQGVDRLDPGTGRIIHYGQGDGLDVGGVEVARRDGRGRLWFGGRRGVSRLIPRPDRPWSPPPVYIGGLRIRGLPVWRCEVGQAAVAGLEIGPEQSPLAIDFMGIGFMLGEALRYQYRLEGVDADWSAPTAERTVNYARLAPGRYRFQVVALSASGRASARPAEVEFTVLPRVWQRWWFLATAALGLGLAAAAAYRYRVARLLEVAHMRTRIATDLHDDIGANLTKIAILSEVAKQQLGAGGGPADSSLASIARISRESVASMSDIVWAINPQRDSLLDLVRRMRLHTEELFTLRGIGVEFRTPGEGQGLRLGVHVRRDVFLIFKEAVNNAARHSRCTRVEIALGLERGWLSLRVADDGSGFDTSVSGEGQGLTSMRRRAQKLGGALEIASRAGAGTEVRLRAPFSPRPGQAPYLGR